MIVNGKVLVVKNIQTVPYKVYKSLLTQSGTDVPVATVLDNTLVGTVVWYRSGSGVYTATLAGAFPLNKTIVNITQNNNGGAGGGGNYILYNVTVDSINTIIVNTVDVDVVGSAYTSVDGALNNTAITIEVYP